MPETDIGREWITVREAAELLSVHPKSIQRACRRGDIRASQISGTWLIARSGFEEAIRGALSGAPAFRPDLVKRTSKGKPRKRRAAIRSNRTTTMTTNG